MTFHWNQSDSKSPGISRTHLSILTNLNNAPVYMVSILPLISSSSGPRSKPNASITINITVTFMLHSFLSSLVRSKCMGLFSPSLIFTLWSAGLAKSTIRQVITRSGCWPRLSDLFLFQNAREIYPSHFPGRILVCAYTVW